MTSKPMRASENGRHKTQGYAMESEILDVATYSISSRPVKGNLSRCFMALFHPMPLPGE